MRVDAIISVHSRSLGALIRAFLCPWKALKSMTGGRGISEEIIRIDVNPVRWQGMQSLDMKDQFFRKIIFGDVASYGPCNRSARVYKLQKSSDQISSFLTCMLPFS